MRVLLTGAAGRIGKIVLSNLSNRYDWVLLDSSPPSNTYGFPSYQVDISDYTVLFPLCENIDVILHLAAASDPSSKWDDLVGPNILGVYNVFEAASQAGCRRVIFASSLHVVDGYPRDLQISPNMPINPLTLYGASKAWGEALAAYYAYQRDLPVLCLRLGWVKSRNDPSLVPSSPHLSYILTDADLLRLIVASLEAPATLRFGIFNGISDNHYKRLDITTTREVLGYEPKDDAFEIAFRNQYRPFWRVKQLLKKTGKLILSRVHRKK